MSKLSRPISLLVILFSVIVANCPSYAQSGANQSETSVSVISSGPFIAGGTLRVTDTVSNSGTAASVDTVTYFYLATSSTATSGTMIGYRSISSLAAGSSSTATTTLTLPDGVSGTFYIIADNNDAWNVWTASSAISVGGPVQTEVALGDVGPYAAGGTFQVTDTVTNTGSGASSSSTTYFYLATSTQGAIDYLGSRNIASLPGGSSSTATTTLTLPVGISGSYYISAYNTATQSVWVNSATFSVSGAALAESSVAVVGSGPYSAGDTTQVTDTVSNTGLGASSSSTTYFYLATSATATTGNLLGNRSIGSIAGSGNSTVTTTLTLPTGTSTGTYYIVACNSSGGSTWSCVGSAATGIGIPSISASSQASGAVGTPLTITGTNFGDTQNTSTIAFNGVPAAPSSWTKTGIEVRVPAGATTGNIVVAVGGLTSNAVNFNVLDGLVGACLFALDPAAQQAFYVSGTANVDTSCSIMVESNASGAFAVNSSNTVQLSNNAQVGVFGGWQLDAQSLVNTTTNQYVEPINVASPGDPYAGILAPTQGSIVSTSPITYDTNHPPLNNTLSPGVYCGGLIIGNTNGVTFTMGPGTYIMAGGGFQIASQAIVTGTGVTVYNTSSNGWGCPASYSYSPITIDGQATATLSAPTSGPMAGVILFGDRAGCATPGACQDFINGGANTTFNGALYFKSDQLVFNGHSSASGCIVAAADEILINGNATFSTNSHCTSDPVFVGINPATATLYAGQPQAFTATVTNASDTAVTWSISPAGTGTIDASGTYTAPASINSQQTVTVIATSQANPAFSASATVTLIPITVSVSPLSVTLNPGQTQQFTATVGNTTNQAVTWSISPANAGTITSSGLYTAPSSITEQVSLTVTATSQVDPRASASAPVRVIPTVLAPILTLAVTIPSPYVTGTSQKFTVVLTNEVGTPIPGAAVTFTVSGANSNIGSSITDSNGGASYSYSGVNNGADTIQAMADVSGAQVTSNAVAVSWIAPAHPISTGAVTGQFFASDESGVFDTSASATPVFAQTFPNMNFNPPDGMATAQMQVTVSGLSVPWRPIGSNIVSTSGMNTGLNPTSIPVIPDEIVNVSYVSGLWSVSNPIGTTLGYSGNWWGSWDANGVPNSSGPALPSANADSLVGGFADALGQIIGQGPLFIGDTFTATAPLGATQLLMGINDGTQWSDNSGALVMNVSLATSSNGTNTTGVTVNTHPFTDVTTDYLGNSTGTIVAEGNGVQAGAVGQLYAFQAVFTGTFIVPAAGDVPIDVFANAGFILGVGDGATPVSGPSTNAPTNGLTPFTGLPVMGALNAPQEQDNVVVVHFSAAGTYHYELDYACSGAAGGAVNQATNDLSLVLRYGQTTAAGNSVFNVVPAITGTLAISPSAPSALGVGQSQTLTITAHDENGNPVPNLPVALVLSGVNEPQMAGAPHVVTTDDSGVATYSYTGINTGNDTLQAVTTIGGLRVTSNTVVVPWTSAPATTGTGGSGTLSISVSAPNTVTLPNSLSLSGTVSDSALASGDTISTTWSVASGPGSVSFANPQQTTTIATFSVPGSYVLQLAASDAINSGAVQFPVTVEPAFATDQGWIQNPANGSEVSGQVAIVLVPGITLQSSQLTYYPANAPNNVTTLSANTSGQIATLDTTTLPNGPYIIELNATNTSGVTQYNIVYVTVVGNNKPGRVTTTATDLVVPANGLAIKVQRTYDSLNANQVGDFGYGWTLGTNVDLTVSPGGNVTFTLGGMRRTFYLTPQFGGFFLPYYFVAYTPEPGFYGSLQDAGSGCPDLFDIVVPDASLWYCLGEGLFSPTEYVYTDATGTAYTINASGALESIRDRNGNTLTITANGITSSAGPSVTFTRDPNKQNRITKIEDQNSNIYQYDYDSNGNLVGVTYPTSATQPTVPATYTYVPGTHLYQSGTDSRGNPLPVVSYYGATDLDPNNLPLNGRIKSVTDALMETTSYTYDLVKNSTTVTYPPDANGNVGTATMVYDSYGMLLSVTDPLSNVTTNEYYANHNLFKVITPSPTGGVPVTTSYTYDSNGNRKSVTYPATAANTNTTSYTVYNQFSEPKSTTDELGNVRTFNYDANFNPQSVTDIINGQTAVLMSSIYNTDGTMQSGAIGYDISADPSKATVFTYDAYGNVASRTDALGRVTSYTYDALGHKLTMTEPLLPGATSQQATTTYTYNSLGNLTNTAAPLGKTTSSQYDGDGNKISDTICQYASACYTTSYTYDALNRLSGTDYPDHTSKTVSYDFRNNVIDEKVYDAHGNLVTDTHYGFDLAGRRTSMTTGYGTAAATTTNYAYHADGHLQTETDGLGHSTNYTYDEAGNLIAISGVKGTFQYGYDAARNRTSVTDGDGNDHTTYYRYDARKRLTQTEYSDGTTAQNGYDGPGNLTSVIDQANNQVQYIYDAANQLQSVVQSASPFSAPQNTTAYGFDALGDLSSMQDANQHTTQYTYDLLGELTNTALPFTPPLAGNETRTYDQAGNLTALQHFNGQPTSYTYDGLNRLLSRSYPGEPTVSFTYTATGKRQTMQDASGTTTYIYDGADRLQKKVTPEGALDYTYNAAGHLASMSSENANGVSVSYTYDEFNRLKTVTDNRLVGQNTTTYSYDPASNLATVSYPNGVQSSFTYDPLNRVTDLAVQGSSQPGTYHYDLNPTGTRKDASEPTGRSVNWSYDGIYRLTNESISSDPNGPNGSVGYTPDPVGNRLSASSSLNGVNSGSFNYDSDDRLTTETYDANGNVTSAGGGRTFTFDSENHLVSMNNGAVTILYDGDGNRVAKSANGVVTYYLVDDLSPTGYPQVVEELSSTGAVQREYTYGLQRISQNQIISGSWTPSFYGYDGFGSVRQLTNSAGVVTDTYEYDAFGVTLSRTGSTPNVYMYRGEQYDPDLGLYYMRARYYNSLTGRFLSRDPEAGKPVDPKTLHKYLYAGGDPVNLIDPTGRTTYVKPTWGNAIGEYAGIIQDISIRVFIISQVTIPAYLRTEQGKALQLLILSGVSIAVAESCELIAIANELNDVVEEAMTGKHYVHGPGMNCNEQPHPAPGGPGEGQTSE